LFLFFKKTGASVENGHRA